MLPSRASVRSPAGNLVLIAFVGDAQIRSRFTEVDCSCRLTDLPGGGLAVTDWTRLWTVGGIG